MAVGQEERLTTWVADLVCFSPNRPFMVQISPLSGGVL
jgi:hypothetical protein